MESTRLQREQNKSEPVVPGAQKARASAAIGSIPLTFHHAHYPVIRLAQTGAFSDEPWRAALQTKLTVNQPGDQYEQEADRIAERVMRMPDPALRLQRNCECAGSVLSAEPCEECASKQVQRRATSPNAPAAAPPVVHEILRSPAQSLDSPTRAFMESRLGHDFSDVRVHTNDRASQSARALNAQAYTVGRDLVFRAGQYAPATESGRKLLAHELVHVIQQKGSEIPRLDRRSDGAGLLGDYTLRPPELPSFQPGSIREAFVIAPPAPATDTQLQLPSSLAGTPPAPPFRILNEQLQAPLLAFPIIIPVPPCIPAQPLTWADFQGAVPAGSGHSANTSFHHEIFDVQGNPMVRAIFDAGSSWVKPPSNNPTDRALSGCDGLITSCEGSFQGNQGGTWNLTPPARRTCAASIMPNPAIVAHSSGDCASVIGPECDRIRVEESARLLRHEQLHFDIACVIARKGNLALRRVPPNQAPRIRMTVENKTNTQTTSYDTQTAHGCNAGAQARWEAAVAADLPSVRVP